MITARVNKDECEVRSDIPDILNEQTNTIEWKLNTAGRNVARGNVKRLENLPGNLIVNALVLRLFKIGSRVCDIQVNNEFVMLGGNIDIRLRDEVTETSTSTMSCAAAGNINAVSSPLVCPSGVCGYKAVSDDDFCVFERPAQTM